MRILIAAPKIHGDYPTSLSYRLMVDIYRFARNKGFDVLLLEGYNANPISFFLNVSKFDVVSYGGHASPISLVGQFIMAHMLAPYGFNRIPKIKDKVIISCPACEPGSVLGPMAIKSGARVFFGSTELMWAGMEPGMSKGITYNFSRDFLKTWFTLHTTYYLTKDPDEALESYRNIINFYIDKYKKEQPEGWEWHVWALEQNRDYMTLFIS